MCAEKKHITLKVLLEEIRKKEIFHLSLSSLNKLLKSIGFKYKRINNRKILCEKDSVVKLRTAFLRKFIQIQKEATFNNFVYLDETWIFQRGNHNMKSWEDDSVKSIRDRGSSEGKRYIVIHAGTKNGFVDGLGKVFVSKSKSQNYHDSMNNEYFKEWFGELLNSLKEPSVIVLDNAPYHSQIANKQPNTGWKKKT